MSFESELKEFIKDYEKLILLGVGNILKKDDGAGPYIISKLEEKENILLIDGQTMPENFTGLIRKANPSHLLIIDACLMNEEPGTIKLVNREDFVNIGISTHSMSLNYFVKYLERDLPVKVANIGIQPESMDFGEDLTLKVYNNCNEFINLMKEIL
ncbi:MAG: hydrogenase maturation peptidase HycI [archaeon]|nr:hydrogenase maturation peptidase HycI [archaeon]